MGFFFFFFWWIGKSSQMVQEQGSVAVPLDTAKHTCLAGQSSSSTGTFIKEKQRKLSVA